MSKFFKLCPCVRSTKSKLRNKTQKISSFGNGYKTKCYYCGLEYNIHELTVEHLVPAIIVRISYGKLHINKVKRTVACIKCNSHRSKYIPQFIGEIVSSPNIKTILASSRKLCDLVRKGYFENKDGTKVYIEELINNESCQTTI